MQTGDLNAYASFKAFRTAVLANPLTIQHDRVAYQSAPDGPRLECFRYDAKAHEQFQLPRIDLQPINLRPEWTHRSPCLNSRFGRDQVKVTVGPIQAVYDFGKTND